MIKANSPVHAPSVRSPAENHQEYWTATPAATDAEVVNADTTDKVLWMSSSARTMIATEAAGTTAAQQCRAINIMVNNQAISTEPGERRNLASQSDQLSNATASCC